MARNEEKAQAMLNRWWNMKKNLNRTAVKERPTSHYKIMMIPRMNDCEKFRNAILKEINKKVCIIQNAGLGEHKIRELNDEINKLIKEKSSFEDRIKELGGPDYKIQIKKMFEDDGDVLPGHGDYHYFGAAKDLPGVRELFQKKKPEPPKKNLIEIFRGLDMEEYFGFKDNANEQLINDEKKAEEKLKQQAIQNWIQQNQEYISSKYKNIDPNMEQMIELIQQKENEDSDYDNQYETEEIGIQKKKNWNDMTEEEKYIEEKKKILLDKYVNIIENNEIENAKEIQDDKYNLDLVKELIEMNKI